MFWRLRHGTGAAGQQQENARLHEQRRSSTGCSTSSAANDHARLRTDAILMQGLDGRNWRLKDYEAREGYKALKKDCFGKDQTRRRHCRGEKVSAARARRRRLSDRVENGRSCHASPRPQVRGVQFGRRRARHLQGSRLLRYNPHSVIEGMIIAGYA